MTEATAKKVAEFDVSNIGPESQPTMAQLLKPFVGQKIALLCARYQYRGTLSVVGENCVVLADATAVEISGASAGQVPQEEDPMYSFVGISLDAVEIFHQVPWTQAPLPSEDGYAEFRSQHE